MFSVEIHVLIVGMASLAGSMAGTSISQDTHLPGHPSSGTPIFWVTHLPGHTSFWDIHLMQPPSSESFIHWDTHPLVFFAAHSLTAAS